MWYWLQQVLLDRVILLQYGLNGTNTVLAVTITGPSTQGSNTLNYVSVTTFDLISVQIASVGTPTATSAVAGVLYSATDP